MSFSITEVLIDTASQAYTRFTTPGTLTEEILKGFFVGSLGLIIYIWYTDNSKESIPYPEKLESVEELKEEIRTEFKTAGKGKKKKQG